MGKLRHVLIALTLPFFLTQCTGGGSTINPPSGGGIVTLTFPVGALPTAVAQSIGNTGVFTPASLQGNQLVVSLPPGTTAYGVAYHCRAVTFPGVARPRIYETIIEATTSEATSLTGFCFPPAADVAPPLTATLTGVVDASAIPGTAWIDVFGRSYNGYKGEIGSIQGAKGAFSGALVKGVGDVAVIARDLQQRLLAVKIVRAQTIPGAANGGAPIVFAPTDAIGVGHWTTSNIPPGFHGPGNMRSASSVFYRTSGGLEFEVDLDDATYGVIAPAQTAKGDYYGFYGSAFDDSTDRREVDALVFTPAPAAVTLALPPPLSYSGPVPAKFPQFDFNFAAFPGTAPTQNRAEIGWGAGSNDIGLTLEASGNFIGPARIVKVPNLEAIPGFEPSAPSGSTVGWSVFIAQGQFAIMQSSLDPPNGTVAGYTNGAATGGNYTEP